MILNGGLKARSFEELSLFMICRKGKIGKVLIPRKISSEANLASHTDLPPDFTVFIVELRAISPVIVSEPKSRIEARGYEGQKTDYHFWGA
jgi:hypothetical protein